MSYFEEIYAVIQGQIADNWEEFKEERRHDDCDDCDDDDDCEGYDFEKDENCLIDEFREEYCNGDCSIHYYKLDDDDLTNSYREGSVWIMRKLLDEYGYESEDVIKVLEKISKDNYTYAEHLIYFINNEITLP